MSRFRSRHRFIPVVVALCALTVVAPYDDSLGVTAASGPQPSRAASKLCTKYAAPWGNDRAKGSASRPFRSAQRLVMALRANQTGCLRGGTYSTPAGRPYVIDITRAGTRIRSFPGERAHVVGIVLVRNTAPSVVLSHLEIEGDGTANTVKIYANDVTVEDNVITNAGRGWSCMILGSNEGYGIALRPIVRRNTFHDCGNPANGNKEHGIYVQATVDGKIVGNVFWRTAAYAVHLYPNAQRTLVAHNVIDGGSPSVRGGIVFAGDERYTSDDNIAVYNIVSDAVAYGISASWSGEVGVGNLARDNCLWHLGDGIGQPDGFTTADNLVASPLFRDQARRDYRLGPASPCLAVVGYDAAARLRFVPRGMTDN